MQDEPFIRIPPPAEQLRLNAQTEKAHAQSRAVRSQPRRDPSVDPGTPAEALRAKYAGFDPDRPLRPPRPPRPAPPVGPRVGPRVGPQDGEAGAPQRPAAWDRADGDGGSVAPVGLQPAANGQKHRPNEHESEQLNAFRRSGRPVELRLRGGELVVGRLLRFDQYSLIVEIGGAPAVVFKHGVDMVRLAPGGRE